VRKIPFDTRSIRTAVLLVPVTTMSVLTMADFFRAKVAAAVFRRAAGVVVTVGNWIVVGVEQCPRDSLL
jgi:hypothetical protein